MIETAVLVALVTAVAGLVGAGLKGLFDRRNNRDNNQLQVVVEVPQRIIDQYQEMNGQLQAQVATLNERVDNLQSRVSTVEMKNDGWRTFYWQVVVPHINSNLGPPAPVPPPALL